MNILVTGGCGYKGHILIPKLLSKGHRIICYDLEWFGNYLNAHPNLETIRGDVRDIENIPLDNIDCIIHLASIANDPCSDLNPKLTWEVSALATMQLADKASRKGVNRFIYASSGSVYGVKTEERVTEDLELLPISEYNKTKMVAERVLLSYQDRMSIQILRPATVCGLSPRMRLDVSVNLLTAQALAKKKITVFGGDQVRPNVHIDDITDAYLFMIDNPNHIGIYNVGFENISILDIARLITKYIDVEIEITESNDPRSYRLDSTKLESLGFYPKKNVESAIKEIINGFKKNELCDEDKSYNLKWMKLNNLF